MVRTMTETVRKIDPTDFVTALTKALLGAGWNPTEQFYVKDGRRLDDFHFAWITGADIITDWTDDAGRKIRITDRTDGGIQVQGKKITIGIWPDETDADLFELVLTAAIGGLS
jgi:hypothetical protein